MNKINIEYKPLIDKWIKALESGEYKHGVGALCNSSLYKPTYCCLGVYCHALLNIDSNGMYGAYITPELVQENKILPELIDITPFTEKLMELNDVDYAENKDPFKDIANFLKNNIEYE